jgi:beta-lysine 5,6-aminomutase alpha subunit
MTGKLNLDPALVARARELARLAGQPVTDLARTHTTVSVTGRTRTGCRG